MRLYILSLLGLCVSVHALSAISGSPCYSACNGDNATSSTDIVCTDSDFAGTAKGQLFKKCMTCLATSTYIKNTRSDATLFLFYLSTVQQICVSNSSSTTRSGCGSTCSGVDSSFTQTGPEFFASPYTYCSANNGGYGSIASDCSSCLQTSNGTVVLGNFVQAGYDACQTRANVTNGELIVVRGDIFNSTILAGSRSKTSNNDTTASSQSSNSTTTGAPDASTMVATVVPQSSTFASSYATPASATGIGGEEGSSSGKSSISPGVAAATGILVGGAGVAGIVALALLARKRQQRALRRRNGHVDFPEKSYMGQRAAASSAALTTPTAAAHAMGVFGSRSATQPVQRPWQNSF